MEYLIKDKLILEIYTIGYEPMGESIVFFIIGDGNVLFTGVVDCYEKEKINRTLELLNEKNVKIVNFVCLTHPDKDHCKGLDKVLEKADSNTHIVYPAYLFKENAKYDNEVNKAVDKIAYFLNLNSNNKNKNYKMTSCIGKQEILSQSQYRYKNLKTGLIYPLIINTYTPIAEIIERYSAKVFLGKNAKPTSHNELSIMLSITLGDFKILLCGDVENETIRIMKDKLDEKDNIFFSNIIDYIKIPHHASDGSDALIDTLNDVKEYSNSVTTVYRSSNLPNEKMLNRYRKKSENLYCTSHIKKEENIEECGVLKLTVDIFNSTIHVEKSQNVQELSKN